MPRRRPSLLVAACLAILLAAGCGLGGGGDDPEEPAAPGAFQALAIQGQPAVGTAYAYGAIPTHPLLDAASDGTCAFVAPTTDPARTQILYVAQPDGAIVPVLAVGGRVPAPADGTISGFAGAWVCPGGIVYAHVLIAGDGGLRTFGVLSSLVTGGGASSPVAVLYDQGSLLAAGPPSLLAGVDVVTAQTEDDGTFWFRGEDDTGAVHLLSVEPDGSALTARASVGGVLTSGVSLLTVDAFAVDPTGVAYALVAGTNLGDQRIYLRPTAGTGFVEVMRTGEAIPRGGGALATLYKNGTLNVYAAGQVVWMGAGSGAAPDDVFMFGDATGAAGRVALARSGDAMPGAGGGALGELFGLQQAAASAIPQFGATIVGAGNGVLFGTVGALSQSGPLAFGTAHGQPSDVGTLGRTYVGLADHLHGYTEVSRDGSFLFANQLAAGGSALLWMIPGVGVFGLAVEGGASPDGADVCGSFAATSAHTVADGVALFRVPLAAAGSGIYRRGP